MKEIETFVSVKEIQVRTSSASELDEALPEFGQRAPALPRQHFTDAERVDWDLDGKKPRVSVIIPFTRPDKIERAIVSVTAQGYPTELLEIIVVGKGSQRLKDKWPELTTVDAGPIFRPGKARNLGAQQASGEVLLFLDDDCEAQEGWLPATLTELANTSVGAVSGMVNGKSRRVVARSVDFSNFGHCQVRQRQERPICTASFGIRRGVFDKVGGFSESMKVHEDIDVCHRLELEGYKSVYQPEVKVLHDHGRSTFPSFLRYMYSGGREGGLAVEETYKELSSFYRFLTKFNNPLAYLLMIIPFSVAATLRAVLFNLKEQPEVVLLSPLMFLGKLSCHLGIWRWTLDSWMGSRGILREVRRLIEYSFLKSRFKTPRVITLFVTSHCNAKCKHCFYWENLNKNKDLTFEEIEELSASLGRLDVLLVSGGEPFLRKDLAEICELFFERNDLGALNIPTNGLQPKTTYRLLRRILEVSRGRPVHLALSIDGTESTHDEIRAVPGNFRKAVETYMTVLPLREEFPNLNLRVNSTVLNKNFDDLFEFFDQHQNHFPDVNTPSLSLLRGSPYDKSLLLPEIDELRALYEHRSKHVPGRRSSLSRIVDRTVFELSVDTLRKGTQVIPCEAGRIQGVVEDNGNVRHCELLPPIGNLREASFDEIWNSDKARSEREKIAKKACHCTHECFLYPSLLANPVAGMTVMVRKNKEHRRP